MNFYPFHLGDYAAHTKQLSLMEDLAYRRMLDLYYTSEAPLPAEPERVARLIGMRDHMQEVCDVLSDFFVKSDNGHVSARCDKEIGTYRAKAERAKSANKSRWSADRSDPNVKSDMKSDLKSDADRIPTNNQEPRTNNQEPVKTKNSAEAPTYRAMTDLLQAGVDEQTAADWLALRSAKNAPATKTAIDAIKREVEIAGMPLGSALVLCCERGWSGFKAAWVAPQPARASPAGHFDIAAAQRAATEEGRRLLFGDMDKRKIDA